MRCPRCHSEETSLSWLQEHSIIYWCRSCRAAFDVDRVAVQSTAKPEPKADAPEGETGES